MIELRGKILVRRAMTSHGKPVLVITGVVDPNVSIENFDDRDEMWATVLQVHEDTIRYSNSQNIQCSPEDFLENVNDVQNKDKWSRINVG